MDQAIGKSYYSKSYYGGSSKSYYGGSSYSYYNGGYYNYGNNYGNNYGYNSYSSGGLTYTGSAWGVNAAGAYAMIPTNQCPYKCSIDMVCGTES